MIKIFISCDKNNDLRDKTEEVTLTQATLLQAVNKDRNVIKRRVQSNTTDDSQLQIKSAPH